MWQSRDFSPWYLGIVTVLAFVSVGSDLWVFEQESGLQLGADGLLMYAFVLVAYSLQWFSSTLAFASLVPMFALTFAGVEALVLVVYGPVILGGVVATANRRFAATAAGLTLAWSISYPFAASAHLSDAEAYNAAWFSVVLVVLGGGAGLFVRLNLARRDADQARLAEARRQAWESAARERRVLARDLHDILAHNLTIITMQASTAQFVGTGEAAQKALAVVDESAQDALVDLRRMLALMREEGVVEVGDEAVQERGMAPAPSVDLELGVARFVHGLEDLGFPVERRWDLADSKVPLSVEGTVYRVLQEAVTNVVKHGDPAHPCLIDVHLDEGDLVLVVENGVLAREPEKDRRHRRLGRDRQRWNSSSVGLTSMRERVSAFDGTVTAGPVGDDRWRVYARVPVRFSADET